MSDSPLGKSSSSEIRGMRSPSSLQDLLDYKVFLLYKNCGLTEAVCRKEFGIGGRLWRILATVSDNEEMTISQISDHANLDLPQTSRAIGLLVRNGYIKRLSNPSNARFAKVILTEAGRDKHEKMFLRYCELNKLLLDALSPEMVEQLELIMSRLNESSKKLSLMVADGAKEDESI